MHRMDERQEDDTRKKTNSLRGSTDNGPVVKRKSAKGQDINSVDQGFVRLRNERLERLEQPLLAGEHWRDVFSGDPSLGNPTSNMSGPWQVSAFALLGIVVVLSAIFLHMVAENNSDSHQTPYSSYRRRQRHARRMYKTRKKKTDEWSDDEEDLIIQKGIRVADTIASGAVVKHPPGDDGQYYHYYYGPAATHVPPTIATPGFTAQEHRQRRTGYKEPNTPPSAGGSGARSSYYLPVNPTYKSPSANMMNITGVHRRGVSPGNSFNSSKSASGKSPRPAHRATTPNVAAGTMASSPNHPMRTTTPLSARHRLPVTPDGKDLFPLQNPSYNLSTGLQPTLPTPPEESQLAVEEAQRLGGLSLLSMPGFTHELGARPLPSSNFSSFASIDDSGNDNNNSNTFVSHGRTRGSSQDTPLSASLHFHELIHESAFSRADSHNSRTPSHESHHRSLMLTPGNYEAGTPQIGNFRKVLSPENFGTAMPNFDMGLLPPGGASSDIPFIPALEGFHLESASRPLLSAAARPPRSVLLDELRIVQMETGSSVQWAVQVEVSESHDESETSHFSDDGDEDHPNKHDSIFDDESYSEDGDDIPVPSGDPRGGIKHKRDDLTKDTDAYRSLQSKINFEDLKLEEVIGGGGFGQVWRATWFGTPVAVKILTGSAQNKHIAKAILEEFKAEINLLKGMRHPNICLYMGACVRPPNRAIVTELAANGSVWDALRLPLSPPYITADGTSKGAWPVDLYLPGQHGAPPSEVPSPKVSAPIPPKGTWPWQLVKRVASGAARGMAYLHHGNPPVLHRDLKSANLLLDESYTAKVCDFGLSRLKAQARSMTGNCGTVQWMAPEVLAGTSYDEKADVFSYGIILWELLSRECPYEGMTAIQCALAVLNRDKRPEIPKWCPPAYHALIKSCIKKDPAERPEFSQVIVMLEAMDA